MIGNGESISCTHKGKLDVICKHKDGSTARQMREVKIVTQLNHDLFSFTKAMKEGWLMNGRWKEGGLMIELFKQAKTSMKFDRMIPSGSSWLMGIKTQRLVGQVHAAIEPGKSVPIWKFHQMTGHTGEYIMKTTADYMGIKLTGKLDPCEACAQAKIRQANIPKKKEPQVPSRPGYRLFIDISSFKDESMGGKRHWLIVVDEFSNCSHSFFLKRKSDQIELLPTWMKELKAKYGIDIKYVRLDNSGENRVLQKACSKQNLGIIFEFTAPGTPQQNSVAERKIPTLMGRSRAMMITAGFSPQDKRKFWCEVISTATKLDNIMVRKDRTKPPFTLFYNEEPKYMKFLRSFGEMAVIAISDDKKMRSKLDVRGRTGIFVGYADDHAGNVYRFIKVETKQIILSRDIQWLNSFWKEYKKRRDDSKKLVDEFYTPDEDDQTQDESETDEPKENEIEETKDSGDGNNTEEQKKLGIDIQMIGAREKELGRTRSQAKEIMSPRNESMERAELTMEDWIHETCLISAVTSGPTEPKTFQEAWHSPVEKERNNWQAAIRKEIKSMINRGVWRKIHKVKKKEFSVKIQHNLADYLGCEFHMNKEKTNGWLGQPSIIKSLEQKFGEKAMKERLSMTPGSPRFIARRLENKEDKVNAEDHETYRSGVGTLLYLTKHSRPDISNPVRELSKTMDAPAPAHLKEMYKLIRLVLSTKDYGLKFKLIKRIRKWVLKALSDSDFASDKETRISIFGYVIYFCGIPIAWRSKGMKSVVLSTTEAEYMALSEVVKELKFIVQLLQTMNIAVELPITVHVDNVGAIWLSNNRNTGDRTKHIDIRTAFVKEYQEDGKIIIKFVKSEDNEADIFTKNTSSIIFQRHQEKLVWDKKEVIEDK